LVDCPGSQAVDGGKVDRTHVATSLLLLLVSLPVALAQDPNACDVAGEEPDLILADIDKVVRWGESDGITAFSFSTVACNAGSCWANWFAHPSNQHPVIGQNVFRLENGRFEQIGQSWVKHAVFAVSGDLCSPNCLGTNGDHLGVNCSDPYSAFHNGSQTELGPKSEVNPATGVHPHPFTSRGVVGDALFKRVQVHDADLDPALHPGAKYFLEGQYLSQDEAAAGNGHDSVGYRRATVFESSGFDLMLTGTTQREKPGIAAWLANDAAVHQVDLDVPGDGRFVLASKVTFLGGGMWHYEYAIQNLTSHRAAGGFSVPKTPSAGIASVGFHDVDYHSGELFAGTDWTASIGATSIDWTTVPHATDPNANALRWGTLYNFRFDANVPPVMGDVALALFLPGAPAVVTVETSVPSPCNSNGTCDPGEPCFCLGDCPGSGADADGDGVGECVDCDDGNDTMWATPGEVLDLQLDQGTTTTLTWTAPPAPGADLLLYEVLRSPDPADFTGSTVRCLDDANPADTSVTDSINPLPRKLYAYLIRGVNHCPAGVGPLGYDSAGIARIGMSCP
jgi:hypothetical protein